MSRKGIQRRCAPVQATPGRAWSARLWAVPEGLEPTVRMQGAKPGPEGWEAKVAGPSPRSRLTLDVTGTGFPAPCRAHSPESAPNR